MPPAQYYHDFAKHHRSTDAARDPGSIALNAQRKGKQLASSISVAWKKLRAEGGEPAQVAEVERIRNVWNGGPVVIPAVVPAIIPAADPAFADGAGEENGVDGDDGQGETAVAGNDEDRARGTKRARSIDESVPDQQEPVLADIPFEIVPVQPPSKKQRTDNTLYNAMYDNRYTQDDATKSKWRVEHKHHHILRHHDANNGYKHCFQFIDGTYAAIAVLAKTDENGNVVDRAIVKDGWKSCGDWMDATCWSGDFWNAQTRVPLELKVHMRLQALKPASRERFSHVRSAKLWNDRRLVRLYMDYCDRNDVYFYLRQVWLGARNYSRWPEFLEPLIWHTLEQLCLACKTLQQGDQDSPGGPWREIVHRDIKPMNVFYTTTQSPDGETLYPKYPRVKLGDFGHAIELRDAFNPIGYTDFGTKGFMAPEQTEEFDLLTKEPIGTGRLGAHTNVYGIGCTIASMLVDGGIPNHFEKATAKQPYGAQTMRQFWAKGFSKDIEKIAWDCCQPDPDHRPTLDDLLQRIEGFMASPQGQKIAAHRGPGPAATAQAILLEQSWQEQEYFGPGVVVDEAYYKEKDRAWNPVKKSGVARVVEDR